MTNIEVSKTIDQEKSKNGKSLQRLEESILKHPEIIKMISQDPEYQRIITKKNKDINTILINQNKSLTSLKQHILKISLSQKLNQYSDTKKLMINILEYTKKLFAGGKTFKEVYNSPDSAGLILAVQYALNIGGSKLDIDGIYGSITKKAVYDFEVSKGLSKNDGQAGPEVITKLIEIVNAEKSIEEKNKIENPTTITVEQAKNIVQKNHGQDLYLNGLTQINKDVAEELVKCKGGILSLDGLTQINKDVAEELAKHEGELSLDGLTQINKDVAEKLIKNKGDILSLGGLTQIDKDVAKQLAKHEGLLHLSGLTQIDKDVAEELMKCKGEITLNGLTKIEDNILQILVQGNITIPLKLLSEKQRKEWNEQKSKKNQKNN